MRGFRHGARGRITAVSSGEDNYDVLARAVLGYNSGESYAEDYSWAKFLKYRDYKKTSSRNTGNICHSCRYSIEVRENIFGANMRAFIWYGGTYPSGHVNADQNWCFAFGEHDWVGGRTWSSVRVSAFGNVLTPSVGRISCP